ncbi:Lecithin:cholesterol acyltransferase family protein [Histomonas meleagridis]|uniref:Lecithin:cholesterol acyltransferase family protein n=1 Tax=Histomonas meleagridis TaxID=135588 RepID=UPI00355A2B8B|nr:Lecithin:cholesterol acyltransferase family protein [Histomonas meleagridis]KAH0802640.1 Lecithin:cholesterol acyltransferase family protein [Histomonas meleagridis]
MLALFLYYASSKLKPIVLIPGAFRSRLNVTTNVQPKWYCSKSINDELFWIRLKNFIPPFLDCFLDFLTVSYNETTHELQNKPDVNIYPDDFGGVNGIRGTGPTIFGKTVPPYYNEIIKSLEKLGYQTRKTLFGAPYDWRFGAAQPDAYFNSLRSLIENISKQNDNEKVIIIAHSLGTQVTHRLLTEKTTAEWRSKYIDSATLIAPSFSGASMTFTGYWRLNSKYISVFKLNKIRALANSLGTIHIHIPHTLGYSNTTLFVDRNGINHMGSELIEILHEREYLSNYDMLIGEQNFKFLRRWPMSPDVDINILYNSGIQTALGLNLSEWKEFGKEIKVPGDGLVGSAVTDWICKNWGAPGKRLQCKDVKSSSMKFQHKNLLFTKDSVNIIMNWVREQNGLKMNQTKSNNEYQSKNKRKEDL